MLLRFENVILDLKYAERIELNNFLLRIRFTNGKEEVIDLREYRDCKGDELLELITWNKDKPVVVSYGDRSKNS